MTEESHLLYKGPCSACGSSDACAVYSDNHTHCFACGAHTAGDGAAPTREGRKRVAGLITDVTVRGLRARKITDETCKHFGYGIGKYKGKEVHVAPYYDAEGTLVAQHLRTQGKEFPWVGDMSDALPFGAHAFPKSGKMLVVTEGEIDALSMSQAQGNKWPVVSIACGADTPVDRNGNELENAGAKVRKYFAKHRDYFMGFEKVILMFDNDVQGRFSAQVAASVLGSRAHIAELPLKDASDMLVAGRTEEMLNAMWRAAPYRPDGIVEVRTLKDTVFAKPVEGVPWFLEELTDMTFGRRLGEVYAFGAGTGVGKTDFFLQQIAYDIATLGLNIATFFFEQEPRETAVRLAGKIGQRPFHIPNAGWSGGELQSAWEHVEQSKGKLFLYDSFGVCDWDVVKERIRYLYHAEDVRHFYIDHLTALAAWQDDERKALELIMSDIGGLVKELGIAVYLISHLATPEGKPHEEGGRVMIRHFKGSRAIGFWCHFMFGLERDQQAADPLDRTTTTFRCLKDRYTGRSTGGVFFMRFDQETTLLSTVDISAEEPRSAGDAAAVFRQDGDDSEAAAPDDF